MPAQGSSGFRQACSNLNKAHKVAIADDKVADDKTVVVADMAVGAADIRVAPAEQTVARQLFSRDYSVRAKPDFRRSSSKNGLNHR